MYDNTSFPAPAQSARFPWPAPGPESRQVTWPEFLALAAEACERAYPGSPGWFLGAYIHALASQATLLQADSPEAHEAAYIHTLEQGAAYGSPAEPGCDLGGWGGHPVEDAGCSHTPRGCWPGPGVAGRSVVR